VGFWLFLFILLWAISGIYLCLPRAVNAVVNFFDPVDPSSSAIRLSDTILAGLAELHFGRFGGKFTKAVWVVFGLAPATLFATGSIMWWNRFLHNRFRRRSVSAPKAEAKADTSGNH